MAEKIAHFHTVWTAKTCGRLLSIRPSIGRRKKLHKYFDGHNCKISKKVACFQILRRTFNTGLFMSICCGNSDFQCYQLVKIQKSQFGKPNQLFEKQPLQELTTQCGNVAIFFCHSEFMWNQFVQCGLMSLKISNFDSFKISEFLF